MRVTLDYGKSGLEVELPDNNVVGPLELNAIEPLEDPAAEIERMLAHPIGCPPLVEIAAGRTTACILICDVTRPVPNRLILSALLDTLAQAGIDRENILILIILDMLWNIAL